MQPLFETGAAIGSTVTVTVPAGSYLAWCLETPTNFFVSYPVANADGFAHFAVPATAVSQSGVSVSAEDTFGGGNQQYSAMTMTAALAPPTVTASSNSGIYTVTEGSPFALTMSASDAASSIASWSVDWGDGTTPDSGMGAPPSTLTHVYGDGGDDDTIAATATNAAGAVGESDVDVTVNDLQPSLQTASIPYGSVNVGQTYTLPTVTFTDPGFLNTHTATIDWGDGNTDDADVTEESLNGTTLVPGTIADSHVYAASGVYTGTITLSDNSGATDPNVLTFNVDVLAATVTLTDFATQGSSLQVTYSVSGAASSPFTIGMYTSPDGTTADQLLSSYNVTDANELAVGSHTVTIPPPAADVSGDYYLIAVGAGTRWRPATAFASMAASSRAPMARPTSSAPARPTPSTSIPRRSCSTTARPSH